MSYESAPMRAVYDGFKAIEPEVELGGIYADKPGYHNARKQLPASDYSVREFAADRQGADDKASAIDLTFPSAQRGDYSKISLYAKRLYAAGRASDPRTRYLREFFGQMDNDSGVEGYDFTKESDATSDRSHLWHIHVSVHRRYTEDPEMTRALLSILRGETVEQWLADGGVVLVPVGDPKPAPVPALDVDGELGPKTIRRWQHVMGTTEDGVISTPSELVRAVQRHLNAHGARLAVDGRGIAQDNRVYNTVRALQAYLGTTRDGRLSRPKSECVRALQRRLNTGKF